MAICPEYVTAKIHQSIYSMISRGSMTLCGILIQVPFAVLGYTGIHWISGLTLYALGLLALDIYIIQRNIQFYYAMMLGFKEYRNSKKLGKLVTRLQELRRILGAVPPKKGYTGIVELSSHDQSRNTEGVRLFPDCLLGHSELGQYQAVVEGYNTKSGNLVVHIPDLEQSGIKDSQRSVTIGNIGLYQAVHGLDH